MSSLADIIPPTANLRFLGLNLIAMVTLSLLDLAGVIAAKEWTEHRRPVYYLAGLFAFGLLFAVFARSLEMAELPILTLGWIVCLQVGITVIDHVRYQAQVSTQTWVIIGIIIVLQGYLMILQESRVPS